MPEKAFIAAGVAARAASTERRRRRTRRLAVQFVGDERCGGETRRELATRGALAERHVALPRSRRSSPTAPPRPPPRTQPRFPPHLPIRQRVLPLPRVPTTTRATSRRPAGRWRRWTAAPPSWLNGSTYTFENPVSLVLAAARQLDGDQARRGAALDRRRGACRRVRRQPRRERQRGAARRGLPRLLRRHLRRAPRSGRCSRVPAPRRRAARPARPQGQPRQQQTDAEAVEPRAAEERC